MKLRLLLLLFPALLLLLQSCTNSTVIVASWANKEAAKAKPHHTIFIAALAQNMDVRTSLESYLADEAVKRNLTAVKSYEVFLPNFTKDNMPTKEEMLKVIKEKKCDAIFLVSLLDVKTESRYVPGSSYAPASSYGYYGGWYGYYGYNYPRVYEAGYYTTDKLFYLESNLFDTETGNILWSAQSETTNPTSIDQFSKDYVKAAMKELVSKGIAKKVEEKK